MEELVRYIITQLVDNKNSIQITSSENEDGFVTISVFVAKPDMGKVIGKNGKIAQAIRAIVKTASSKLDKKYLVKIAELEE